MGKPLPNLSKRLLLAVPVVAVTLILTGCQLLPDMAALVREKAQQAASDMLAEALEQQLSGEMAEEEPTQPTEEAAVPIAPLSQEAQAALASQQQAHTTMPAMLEPAQAVPQLTPTAFAPVNGYPQEAHEHMMQGCLEKAAQKGQSTPEAAATCECMIGKMEEKLPYDEFIELAGKKDLNSAKRLMQVLLPTGISCASKA